MFKHISVQDAKTLLDQDKGQFVDIRDTSSFTAGHIPGASLLNQETIETFIQSADLDAPLLVCCYHGNSSQSAAQFLAEKGFEDVYSIDGGFEEWRQHYTIETSE